MGGNAERQATLRARRAAVGLVQVQVYVHESRREELRALAEKMKRPRRRREVHSASPTTS